MYERDLFICEEYHFISGKSHLISGKIERNVGAFIKGDKAIKEVIIITPL